MNDPKVTEHYRKIQDLLAHEGMDEPLPEDDFLTAIKEDLEISKRMMENVLPMTKNENVEKFEEAAEELCQLYNLRRGLMRVNCNHICMDVSGVVGNGEQFSTMISGMVWSVGDTKEINCRLSVGIMAVNLPVQFTTYTGVWQANWQRWYLKSKKK